MPSLSKRCKEWKIFELVISRRSEKQNSTLANGKCVRNYIWETGTELMIRPTPAGTGQLYLISIDLLQIYNYALYLIFSINYCVDGIDDNKGEKMEKNIPCTVKSLHFMHH